MSKFVSCGDCVQEKTCDPRVCGGEKIVINDYDKPEEAMEKVVNMLGEIVEKFGTTFMVTAIDEAQNRYNRKQRAEREGRPCKLPGESRRGMLQRLTEVENHTEQLDDYVADLLELDNEFDDVDDRLSHIEEFLVAHCNGFEPLYTYEDDDDPEDDYTGGDVYDGD